MQKVILTFLKSLWGYRLQNFSGDQNGTQNCSSSSSSNNMFDCKSSSRNLWSKLGILCWEYSKFHLFNPAQEWESGCRLPNLLLPLHHSILKTCFEIWTMSAVEGTVERNSTVENSLLWIPTHLLTTASESCWNIWELNESSTRGIMPF